MIGNVSLLSYIGTHQNGAYLTDHPDHPARDNASRHPSGPLKEKIQQTEVAAAQDILQEGLRYVSQAETLSREGRPEQEIIQCAAEWHADLIVICSRSPAFGGLALGPKSVGHVARFVLDHAPCPVLLVRPLMSEKVSLPSDVHS